ncbi:MAG: tRNA 2-thiouridine(34) synthase MnmA [Oligoflexia bacterium]|nr:tRNA 2-thiouridine(34) synthase MnmA [Oligoflexia bacterium]
MQKKSKGKVVVAMSGGVDSSVAAALLQLQGYEVIGMSIQTFDANKEDKERFDSCCSISDMNDARRVCEKLGAPFFVVNAVEAFESRVIDHFVSEYLNARTPNPCVLCNNHIKFDYLLEKALEIGADSVATGHYAKVHFNQETGRYSLLKAVDEQKDQSYYLFGLSQEQLRHTLMPLGDLRKIQVRKMAEEFGLLRVSKKPDSQEICFVGSEGYAKFIEKKVGPSVFIPGSFFLSTGELLGHHTGVHQYTIGQRKGLPADVLSQAQKLGFHELYVKSINLDTGKVILDKESDLFKKSFLARDFNWLAGVNFSVDRLVSARIRSRHEGASAKARLYSGNRVIVEFEEAQRAITPGQAVVLYDGDEVLGGGWIEKVYDGSQL